MLEAMLEYPNYRKTSNISCILVGNEIVDNSDVVGAVLTGAATRGLTVVSTIAADDIANTEYSVLLLYNPKLGVFSFSV